jgi:CCR4-NOT transcription complex subunit 9
LQNAIMSGVLSPKPLYMHSQQYNPYRGPSAAGYSDVPSVAPTPALLGQHHAGPPPPYMPALTSELEQNKIFELVIDLMEPARRETALLELSKKREQYEELALILWHSFGAPGCSTDDWHMLNHTAL